MGEARQRGFTLVELLVVISIIGLLAAALITQVTKVRETARSLKCKTNLKSLAQAALSYASDTDRMPWAGTHEHVDSNRAGRMTATQRKGWVDWTTSDGRVEPATRDYTDGSSLSAKGRMITAIDGTRACTSITNGDLWAYAGRDLASYACEAHKARCKSESGSSALVFRSYFMSGYYGYNKDYYPISRKFRDIWLNNLSSRGSSERLLLFAELAVKQPHNDNDLGIDGVIETKIVGYNDGRDTKTKPKEEIIGFNHLVGRRYVAHVAYADGHVDVFHSSGSELDDKQMKGLVYYLCNGYDLPKNPKDWKIP